MSKTTKIILAILVVAVIAIGIGYANVSNTLIEIKGTVSAQAEQTDFKLAFTGDGVVTKQPEDEEGNNKCIVTTTKTSDTNATFSVSGLQVVGDEVVATYTFKNNSTGIVATNVAAKTTAAHTSNDYITTTVSTPTETTLAPGESATVTVTTKLIKTPLTPQSQTVGIEITAEPAEVTE